MSSSKFFQTIILIIVFLPLTASALDAEEKSSTEFIKPILKRTKATKNKGYVELPPWGYEPRKVDKRSEAGKKLYQKHNCRQCHAIGGTGGELGPPLDGIGGHRGPEWLLERMLDPEKQMKKYAHVFGNRTRAMPHPALDKEEAQLIVEYILTLPEPKEGYLVASHSARVKTAKKLARAGKEQNLDRAMRGAKIFYDMHCYTCHSLDGSKDRFGPDLSGISQRIEGKNLKKFLKKSIKSSIMKNQSRTLKDDEVKDLQAFLLTVPAE